MLFTSPVFLFLFLPIVLGAYFIARSTTVRNAILIVASMIFYCWGELPCAWIVVTSIIVNFTLAREIEKHRTTSVGKWLLALACALNLSSLAWFKYATFFAKAFNVCAPALNLQETVVPDVRLPLGISFFTFHCISYIVDVYRGTTPAQHSLPKMILYISFFPQLIAGPIVRYKDISQQLTTRTVNGALFAEGVERFIIGLSKKLLIANTLATPADQIFALDPTLWTMQTSWLALTCFGLQIYFDFSGYSDMAIGIALMFGFKLRENFNYPYISLSITEFWQRWHISLSTWFRDYLYLPLGGSQGAQWRTCVNMLAVFLLCGLWHGANWTFLVFGLYHGFYITLERSKIGQCLAAAPSGIRRLYFLFAFMTGLTFFRADNISDAFRLLALMFGLQSNPADAANLLTYLNAKVAFMIAVGLFGCTPIIGSLMKASLPRLSMPGFRMPAVSSRLAWVCTAWCLCIAEVAAGSYNPFIYFRF